MTTKTRKTRSLKMESLENRNLMAGNVLVDLFPSGTYKGDVRVTGDDLGNSVIISEVSSGTFRVTGVVSNGSATKVNGKAFVDIHTKNDDLWIDMRGGNDDLQIGNKTSKMTVEDLGIKMGDGADTIFMARVEVYEKFEACNIDLGSESDNRVDGIVLFDSVFKGDLNLSMGAGNDNIQVASSEAQKKMNINTGSGNDKVLIDNSAMNEVYAQLGAGNSDELTISNTKAKKLNVDGGSGNADKLEIGFGNKISSISKSGIEKYIR